MKLPLIMAYFNKIPMTDDFKTLAPAQSIQVEVESCNTDCTINSGPDEKLFIILIQLKKVS